MNDTEDKTYIEFPGGQDGEDSKFANQVDPVDLESPFFWGQNAYRITAQLLTWAAPKIVEYDRKKPGKTEVWANSLGCDCAFITEAMNGVRRIGEIGGTTIQEELVDLLIYVDSVGITNLQPVWHGKIADEMMPAMAMADYYDWIIVCRPFERNCGHGLRWMEVSASQATRILKKWNGRVKARGRVWRPRTGMCGDNIISVFLTNLPHPVPAPTQLPPDARDVCICSQHRDGASAQRLQRCFQALRDLHDAGDQVALNDIANAAEENAENAEKLVFLNRRGVTA